MLARRSRRSAAAAAAGEQRDGVARGREEARQRPGVLLGEDLGGRHDRDLQPALERDERRQRRDQRLARAHVALQQPVHRLGPLQIGDDVAHGDLLPRRERERQQRPRLLAQRVVDPVGVRLALGEASPPSQQDAGLEREELLEDQPHVARTAGPVEGVDVAAGRRLVHRGQGVAPRRQIEPAPHSIGQRVGQSRWAASPAPAPPARAGSSASACRCARRSARCRGAPRPVPAARRSLPRLQDRRRRPRPRHPASRPRAARRRGSRTAGWRTAGRRRPAPPSRTAPRSGRRAARPSGSAG